jgi:V/A-type H+-transporting ATPase subunit E
MQPKLQELTEKIYQEGVERGNQEAEKIISKAREEAALINKQASAEAVKIVEQAKQKALEIQNKTQSELKLSGRQALNSLKQQITELVVTKTVQADVKKSFEDISYLKDLILAIVQKWNPASDGNLNLNLILPADKETELKNFIESKAKSLLSKGLTLQFTGKLKNGFEISPSDGSFKISFTDEDFTRFFGNYVRPAIASLLFEGDK